jgi:TetR/AcrR family transcriptional repressor of bet genes
MPGTKAPEDERREAILKAAFRVAARERLTGLTAQAVAHEAGVSKGLVFFHFGSRDGLLVELLDWLLEHTVVARADDEVRALPTPQERLLEVIRRDVEALPKQRERVELFFDYWVMGTRHPGVRDSIRAALDRYRDALRPLSSEVVAADPERYAGITADGLAGVAAGFIEGCALQVVMDPERFSVARSLDTLRALVARPRGRAAEGEGTMDETITISNAGCA